MDARLRLIHARLILSSTLGLALKPIDQESIGEILRMRIPIEGLEKRKVEETVIVLPLLPLSSLDGPDNSTRIVLLQ